MNGLVMVFATLPVERSESYPIILKWLNLCNFGVKYNLQEACFCYTTLQNNPGMRLISKCLHVATVTTPEECQLPFRWWSCDTIKLLLFTPCNNLQHSAWTYSSYTYLQGGVKCMAVPLLRDLYLFILFIYFHIVIHIRLKKAILWWIQNQRFDQQIKSNHLFCD